MRLWPFTLVLPVLAAPAGGIDVSVFFQYGVLGVVSLGLIWFSKGSIQRERDRADRLEADNQRLNDLIRDTVIPAMTSATRAAEESATLLSDLQRERQIAQAAEHRRGGKGGL